MSSIDVFAATNPAFCGLIIWSFVGEFGNGPKGGCELPLAFLPLPIVLSEDLSAMFAGTNATTGYLAWIGRHPEVTIDFGSRMQRTVTVSREAILYGLRYGILRVNDAGRLEAIENPDLPNKITKLPSETRQPIRYAARLGAWLYELNTTETALFAIGVSL